MSGAHWRVLDLPAGLVVEDIGDVAPGVVLHVAQLEYEVG